MKKNKLPIKIAGMIFTPKKYCCVWCKKEIKGFKDRLSAREYKISGLCQSCQNKTFESERIT